MSEHTGIVLLSADDFALTDGVTRAIEDLAQRRLLSATSALVTTRHWPAHGPRLAALRDKVAIGLHLNLTLGAPLGVMQRLAPGGGLPTIGALTFAALTRQLDRNEIADETRRQLDAFEAQAGAPPDFIDGHQHVHALPTVRDAVLAVLSRRAATPPLLVRNPADRSARMMRRRGWRKALLLAGLSAGFGRRAERAGLIVNDSFAGVTNFRPEAAAADIASSLSLPGRLHVAMCHPGFPDAELAAIDPVTVRRQAEYDALVACEGLQDRIWHPRRGGNGTAIDWQREMGGT